MSSQLSELRLPADRAHILVAKRATTAFAALAGFNPDGIDDLAIAICQACENAIVCLENSGTQGALFNLRFITSPGSLEIRFRTNSPRSPHPEALQYQPTLTGITPLLPESFTPTSALALRLMSLFVDDSSYRLSPKTGNLKVRLVKFRTP